MGFRRRSLARITALVALLIATFTTCKLDKLMGPASPPATKLVFQVQPQNALANQTFGSAVKVYVANAAGDTVTDATNVVSIGITPGTGAAGAVLGGTIVVSPTNGVATFSTLKVDKAGTGYTLTASSGTLTPAVSTAFTIIVPPTIALAPPTLTFTASVGGSNPATQTVAVTNSGGSTLSGLAVGPISYGAGASGWLTATPSGTTAPATITVNATTGSLAVGTYTATIPVTSSAPNVTNSPQNIAVTFTVSQAPTITLSATTRSFSATPGGSNPAPQTVAVTNTGTGTLNGLSIGNITYGAGATGWLAAVLDVTTAPATITMTATSSTLVAGTYTATVPVLSSAVGVTNSPQTIAVTLTVSNTPTIALSPTSRTFTATVGGSSPASQTVSITNSGNGTLSGLSTGTITYGAGATNWLTVSLSGPIAPATVTLTATLGSLSAGTYTATVPVLSSASGVTNSPQNITVTFTVSSSGSGMTTINSATPIGLGVSGSLVYWGDYSSTLRTAPVTGGTSSSFATGLSSPRAVTTDGVNIYWIESTGTSSGTVPFATAGASIRKMPVGGGTPTTIASNQTVARVDDADRLETDGSFVYYIAQNTSAQWGIQRIPVGGGVVVELFSTGSTTRIPGFTLSGGVLYFVDGTSVRKITNPTANSGFVNTVVASAAGYVMRNAVVIAGTLYFSGRVCGDAQVTKCYEIISVPIAGGSVTTKFSSATEWTNALATDGTSLYAFMSPPTQSAGAASVYRIDPSTFSRTLLGQTTGIAADGGYGATILINGSFVYWTDAFTGIYRVAK